YMVAVQAALGAAAQNLVADSERHARAAVRHLQTRGLGRATFLALDVVRGSRPSADDRDLIHQAGVVGWAMDLIRVRPEFRPAAQHALGRVLVLEALDDAVVVGRLISFRYRLVTLDGQIIHPGGAITGGSPASTGAVWVRKQEIERLGRELVVELQRLDGARERVAGVEQERDQVTVRLREIEALVRPLRERLAETRSRVTALHELTATVGWDENPTRLEAELAARVQEARAAGAQLGSLEERLHTLREEDAAGRARLDEVDQAWTRRREELARLKTERDRAQARRLERERRRESLLQEREAGAERLRLATDERDAKEAELALLLDRQRELDASRSGHERELRQTTERTRALEAELRRRERQREHLSDRHERLLFQLAQLGDAAAPMEETLEEDVPALRERLSIVEAELQGIGPIIPGSVALEDRLTARVAFLQHHRADIERAVAELEQTIADLDREVESRRTATAAELEAAVRRAVQELFGGGAARFEWTSEPEPGLELWVEPPSKRPQSLQSLSGGEKALGALAWLFALLALRPAPLVVLDEVEASLDELNARRFAQHLKRNRNVQYLVVSHHKPTMEQADALWGFSSDSHGVSRLVSVRLGEESGVS
ncbi:MAG: AAA family ATPase, partial [Clostridia bacterium]